MTAVHPSPTEPPSTRAPRAGARIRAGKIVANLSTAALYEAAARDGGGMIAAEGPLVVSTGTHTGRSPKDKFIVREPSNEVSIWWGDVNHPITEEHYDRLRARLMDYLAGRRLYSQDMSPPWRPSLPLPLTVTAFFEPRQSIVSSPEVPMIVVPDWVTPVDTTHGALPPPCGAANAVDGCASSAPMASRPNVRKRRPR